MKPTTLFLTIVLALWYYYHGPLVDMSVDDMIADLAAGALWAIGIALAGLILWLLWRYRRHIAAVVERGLAVSATVLACVLAVGLGIGALGSLFGFFR